LRLAAFHTWIHHGKCLIKSLRIKDLETEKKAYNVFVTESEKKTPGSTPFDVTKSGGYF
jgi:hypothetical protein